MPRFARPALLVLSGLISASCAGMMPQSFSAVARPDTDPFACVTRELSRLGFTMTSAERDAGLIISELQDGQSALSGWRTYQYLTFNILDDGTINVQARREGFYPVFADG